MKPFISDHYLKLTFLENAKSSITHSHAFTGVKIKCKNRWFSHRFAWLCAELRRSATQGVCSQPGNCWKTTKNINCSHNHVKNVTQRHPFLLPYSPLLSLLKTGGIGQVKLWMMGRLHLDIVTSTSSRIPPPLATAMPVPFSKNAHDYDNQTQETTDAYYQQQSVWQRPLLPEPTSVTEVE